MKKIRHSKLPITLESSDTLTNDMLEAIEIQMTAYAWDSCCLLYTSPSPRD